MFINYLTDFGFRNVSQSDEKPDYSQVEFGPKSRSNKGLWVIAIYILFSAGIFLRRIVNFPNAADGVNTSALQWGILIAAFIIGLAMLAPLLRIISRFHRGKLSYQHCLTAFTIGFFSDMTFQLLLNGFMKVLA